MNYHIIDEDGKVIASFVQETDRDIYFDAMVEYWGEDCKLKIKDD